MLALTPNIQVVIAAIYSFLCASSLFLAVLVRVLPRVDFTDLKLRTRAWWFMIGALTISILLGKGVTLALTSIVSYLALKEFLSAIPTRRVDRPFLLLTYVTIPIQTWLIAIEQYDLFIVFIPLYASVFLPVAMLFGNQTQGYLRATATLGVGLFITVYLFGHLSYLLLLPDTLNPAAGSLGLMVYLVFLAQSNDVSQYIFGKLLGRHRLVPGISPGKTAEGLAGGLCVTIFLALLAAPWLTSFGNSEAVFTGCLIALCGFAGDVTLSAIKRDLGIKDWSQLLPGHGGILDRIDSLVFTAPLFFHFIAQRYAVDL
jgi:phosphatidate cytidylyltransferase